MFWPKCRTHLRSPGRISSLKTRILSIQSPVLRGQVADKSMTEGGEFLIAQNQSTETDEAFLSIE